MFRPALVLSLLVVGAPTLGAELYCPRPEVRLGEVRSGVPLAQRFPLVNRGPEPLDVIEVHPSCGCLSPRLSERHFRPGQEGTLLLEINTLTVPAGTHSWGVRLRYRSSGKEDALELLLHAQVRTEVTIEPAAVTLCTDSALEHRLKLIDRRPSHLNIVAVETTQPRLRVQAGAFERDGRGTWVCPLALKVEEDYPEGRHDEKLHLFTSDPDYRELRVPLTVVKRSRRQVQCLPDAVSLLGSGQQPLPSRIVLLSGADDQPVLVERVETDHPAIACRWAAGPGTRATLKVEVERDRIRGSSLEGCVRIHLKKPTPQILLLPVHCTIR